MQIKIHNWKSHKFRPEIIKSGTVRAIPANARLGTWKDFKARNREHYTFQSKPSHIYYGQHEISYPHLVLNDAAGRTLFVLGYLPPHMFSGTQKHIEIQNLQRDVQKDGNNRRLTQEAKRLADEFKGKTGINADEFLMSEFIYLHKEELLKGVKMYILDDPKHHETVASTRDRFCKKTPVTLRTVETPEGKTAIRGYEIDIGKERIKWIFR
ncbi:MAG: hypothetical protein HY544_04900 [Candidatus Diapherotrites archaeon]|uniref:Uncharacterized protein n=1 Tax=Candidatus Iainarchaeum sp. TaxID=3101447 RepID=A0A8T3YNH3_9ARCH|nr:hypothetical protein [Candidatus Diapherotrites archaeon]